MTLHNFARYGRLYAAFFRYCLTREMSFRLNFLMRSVTSVAWLAMILLFFDLIFNHTKQIGGWSPDAYLFFMGTGFILNGLVDCLFLDNCNNLSQLIRSGDLDFALTKPVDEQFLLSTQRIDLAEIPNVLVGIGCVIYSLNASNTTVTPVQVFVYLALLTAGVLTMYSLMLAMSSASVWFISNRGLYEVWFYVTQFARYPADIYKRTIAGWAIYLGLMFILPVLLAINVPAAYGAGLLSDYRLALYLLAAAGVCLLASRRFFRYALSRYRSASS